MMNPKLKLFVMRIALMSLLPAFVSCQSVRETPCLEYAAEAALRGLEMCYTQVKRNADEAQKDESPQLP